MCLSPGRSGCEAEEGTSSARLRTERIEEVDVPGQAREEQVRPWMKAGRGRRGSINFWNYHEEGVPSLPIRRKRRKAQVRCFGVQQASQLGVRLRWP